ncbi:hypothetical protein C4568_02615 [Candidatus Parcubacteria bacterium]|nr:MAG: hypothetical protein C4568_02615 [Candidatus Parcubacteria bacterium]
MTVDALTILAGVVVAVLPFLGFPSSWVRVILFILGLCIVILGIVVRRRLSQKSRTQPLPFDESR